MQVNDIYTVKIEKMLNGAKALSHVDLFPVFVENACAGDILKIKINRINKNYAQAQIVEIVQKSGHRVTPKCSLSKICGSCDWQFTEYSEQLRQKQNIVFETLHKFADFDCEIQDIIPSPKIFGYRCKIQYPVSQTEVSKRILTGYYKKNTHELINIKFCHLSPDIINEINEFLKLKLQEFNIEAYNEKIGKGLLRHIIYRISSDLTSVLIIFVLNSEKFNNEFRHLSDVLRAKYPQIKGICANYNNKKTNVIMGKNTEIISGSDFYIEELSGIKYKISANSFFQVNPYCAEKIFDTVKNIISAKIQKPRILDAYSGVSSFGIWLSSLASEAVSVEEVISASNDAIENVKLNNISNLTIINGDAAKVFSRMIKNNEKFDVSIIDPPRKGCSEEAVNNLTKLTSGYIVYVSCNVATLARDMSILIEKGFTPVYIQPADMFPNTYHVETIVLFEKTTK